MKNKITELFPAIFLRYAQDKLRERFFFRVISCLSGVVPSAKRLGTKTDVSRVIFFLIAFSVQAQTSYYHQTRTFVPVEINIQGTPTEYELYQAVTQLTSIVKGAPIQIDTNNTYAIEKQAIAVGFETSVDAWNAATNYNGPVSNHMGKVYNNVGWVRGIKSTNGAWGAYIWTLQNRIAFQSSTSSWWKNEDCIPVAISNVMVGSLGNYGPMSNVVDIGPVLDTIFAYPEAGQTNEATYQVDYTNVFYELIIPDIWINPIEAVTVVGGGNVQFTVYGTNIPNGVTWTISETNFAGHAVLQTNVNWHYASVTPGNVATNYKIRATSTDNTNFYDEVNLAVIVPDVEFKKYASCAGFDGTISPSWIMVPEGGNNLAKADISPSAIANQIGFESDNTNITLVSPVQASTSPQTITVSGVTNGSADIQAKLAQTTNVYATLGVDVKKRIDKTIVIHAITEENDDVQVIPVDQGQPNQICIMAGTNGVLDSSAGGDDMTNANTIITGPNGVCESEASGDDVPVIDLEHGQPNAICVTKGVNNFRDTNPSGYDAVNGDSIDTGNDGICDTTANSTNLVPANVPSAAELENYLNNTTWGKQANVYFTVTSSNATVNYDINRDGGCADSPFTEIETIDTAAKNATADFNIYYVKTMEVPNASTRIALGYSWIGDSHENSTVNITAHETGHLLSIEGDSSNIEDLMLSYSSSANPSRVIKNDWDKVNP